MIAEDGLRRKMSSHVENPQNKKTYVSCDVSFFENFLFILNYASGEKQISKLVGIYNLFSVLTRTLNPPIIPIPVALK